MINMINSFQRSKQVANLSRFLYVQGLAMKLESSTRKIVEAVEWTPKGLSTNDRPGSKDSSIARYAGHVRRKLWHSIVILAGQRFVDWIWEVSHTHNSSVCICVVPLKQLFHVTISLSQVISADLTPKADIWLAFDIMLVLLILILFLWCDIYLAVLENSTVKVKDFDWCPCRVPERLQSTKFFQLQVYSSLA